MDHILEFGDKMNLDSFQEGLIPDTETLSISNLPLVCAGLQRAAERSACRHHKQEHTLAKNKTYQFTLAQTKDILAETLDEKPEGQNWSIKYNILNQARQQLFYFW